MPALPAYIPNKDADFGPWLDNFSALATASPSTYGLVAGDATAIAAVTAAWDAAYALATSPMTRTPTTVQAKVDARIAATATVRPYAQQISVNAGVASSDKIAIGVNPRTSVPTPIAAPTTYPILSIPSSLTLAHVVRYRDDLASPTSKAKPFGAVQIQLFAATSATPITDPAALPLVNQTTLCPFIQPWPSAAAGKIAYYAGRWVTRRGLVGPFGPIIPAVVTN